MMSKEDLEKIAFTQKQFTNSIQKAQKQMEGRHFGTRKHLFDYDSVINKQRMTIYAKRDEILLKAQEEEDVGGDSARSSDVITPSVVDEIAHFIDEAVGELVTLYASVKPWQIEELLEALQQLTT